MLPALAHTEYRRSGEISILITEDDQLARSDAKLPIGRLITLKDYGEIVRWIRRERVPTIIATPTSSHMHYVDAIASVGIPFAVEKPICDSEVDQEHLMNHPEMMENGFALSYYCLEKALPVTFLFTKHSAYRGFLECTTSSSIPSNRELERILGDLGRMKSIAIRIFEGHEQSPRGNQRSWTEQPPVLETFIETTIHPLAILATILGTAELSDSAVIDLGVYGPRLDEVRQAGLTGIAPTLCSIGTKIRGVDVSFVVAKYVSSMRMRRDMDIFFEEGMLRCNFDTSSMEITRSDGTIVLSLRLKDDFLHSKYRDQLEMFRNVSMNGWGFDRFDGLESQLTALGWWRRLCELAVGCVPIRYDDDPPVLEFLAT
jgi:hypothetical protein